MKPSRFTGEFETVGKRELTDEDREKLKAVKKEVSNIVYYGVEISNVGTKTSGNYDHEGRHGEVGGSKPNPSGSAKKSADAKKNYKPKTAAKEAIAMRYEVKANTYIGGTHLPDNEAFDVLTKKNAWEVKAIIEADNDKITMHGEKGSSGKVGALRRKFEEAERLDIQPNVLVFDTRNGKMYYANDLGNFRLPKTTRAKLRSITPAELKKLCAAGKREKLTDDVIEKVLGERTKP